MQSKITGAETTWLFTATVLNKYPVNYYRCNQTGFIQTEQPYWLHEAYSSAINKLDVGLPYRNIKLSQSVESILLKNFNADGRFLDYAGGYGLFTRLMRDNGFDFYTTDKHCENIFAKFFDLDNAGAGNFELVTCFEVLEHLADPYRELNEIFNYADNLFFTTELQPKQEFNSADDWWYFIPETGQHVSFYTLSSLEYIAKKLDYNLYSNGINQHLFTKKPLAKNPFTPIREPFFTRKARKFIKQYDSGKLKKRDTLLISDWELIKARLQ